jgi:endonuclease/exonuclease/phosphatase (EEP) superfamily protein YafD
MTIRGTRLMRRTSTTEPSSPASSDRADAQFRSRTRNPLRVLGWGSVAVAAAGLVLRIRNVGVQPLIVAATFAPFCVVPAVAGVGLLAGTRSRCGTAVGAVVALSLLSSQVALYVAQDVPVDRGISLVLLSGNLRRGQADASQIVDLARAEKADVVALQELTPTAVARLTSAGMDELFPFSNIATAAGAAGVGLWSRHPMTATNSYPGFHFGVVSGAVSFGSGNESRSMTFLSTHLVGPWPGPPWAWSDELSGLGKVLHSLDGPVVDGGDFNATLDHAQFRHLLQASGFSDGAAQAGAGLIRSYPADTWYPPMIGIDHVLTREAIATRMKTISMPGSDHRGLITHLRLP